MSTLIQSNNRITIWMEISASINNVNHDSTTQTMSGRYRTQGSDKECMHLARSIQQTTACTLAIIIHSLSCSNMCMYIRVDRLLCIIYTSSCGVT